MRSIRNSFLLCIVIFPLVAVTQVTTEQQSITVQEAKEFFSELFSLKTPERGEFETMEEYQKRLPKPFDTTRVYYLPIAPEGLSFVKAYKYDVDRQVLTYHGGGLQEKLPRDHEVLHGIPIRIWNDLEFKGSYEAENAFGHKVTVEKVYDHDYVLNLTNLRSLPDSIYDAKNHRFQLSIQAPPKEAERLSSSLTLVVGIRPFGPTRSFLECTLSFKPTIDAPYEGGAFVYWADVQFVELLLYDKDTKQTVKRYSLEQ